MNFSGILIGLGAFLIIGILHPVVIKAEYYWGKRCWPLFLVAGLASTTASLFVPVPAVSALCAVLGFSLFWGIGELFEQEDRVRKGWFPANPQKRTDHHQGI